MAEQRMPHQGHENHLCYLANLGFVQSKSKDYKELVKGSQFVCMGCGRTAVSEKSLCKPDSMGLQSEFKLMVL